MQLWRTAKTGLSSRIDELLNGLNGVERDRATSVAGARMTVHWRRHALTHVTTSTIDSSCHVTRINAVR